MFKKNYLSIALALFAMVYANTASAYFLVYSPTVEYGETEIEFYIDRTDDDSPLLDGAEQIVLEVGKGITEKLYLAGKVIAEKAPGGSREVEEYAVEAVYQLTEQGEFSWDFGLLGEIVYGKQDSEIEEVEIGLLMATDISDKLTFTTNLIAEYENDESKFEGGVSAQFKYRLMPELEPAFEIYADEYNTVAGPVIKGTVKTGADKIGYELGWLFGVDDDSADNTVKLIVEYEF